MIPAFLRPFLAGILLIPLMSIAGWIAAHNGPTIPTEQVHKIVDYLLELVFPLLAGGAVIFRRFVDKKVNPGNAASSHVAVVEKELSKDLKAGTIAGRLVSIRVEADAPTSPQAPPPATEPPRHFRPPLDE